MFKGEQYDFFNGNYTYCDENNCDRWLFDDLYETLSILNDEVELIEEQQDIDIQGIQEYKTDYTERCIDKEVREYINKTILPAIKQLDKKINKEWYKYVCRMDERIFTRNR